MIAKFPILDSYHNNFFLQHLLGFFSLSANVPPNQTTGRRQQRVSVGQTNSFKSKPANLRKTGTELLDRRCLHLPLKWPRSVCSRLATVSQTNYGRLRLKSAAAKRWRKKPVRLRWVGRVQTRPDRALNCKKTAAAAAAAFRAGA